METIEPSSPVGEIVATYPQAARIFANHLINFWSDGWMRLDEACLQGGLEPALLVSEIEKANRQTPDSITVAWSNRRLSDLVNYIVSFHHGNTRTALGKIRPQLEHAVSVHGEKYPVLEELHELFTALYNDLPTHLMKEEMILFPYIIKLDQGKPPTAPSFGTVANPIRVMRNEHEVDGKILRRMLEATQNFSLSADETADLGTLYAGLRNFSEDLMQHMHLENNILFPLAVEAEESLLNKTAVC